MRVLSCQEPGRFEFRDAEIPPVKEGETLLKVRHIGICGTDLHAFEGTQPYFSYPRVLGHELAAVVAEGGGEFSDGEWVTFLPYLNCGRCHACRAGKTNCCVRMEVYGVHRDGGMQDYVAIPTRLLARGDGVRPEALALTEPLAIGAHAIRRAGVAPDETVLVVGAGPIGLATLEFARLAGAEVIAMDVNSERLAFCRHVLNVTQTIQAGSDYVSEQLLACTDGRMPDVVIDATGNLGAVNSAFQFISHGGRFVLVGLQKGDITFSHPEFHKREATLMSSRNATRQDFDYVLSMVRENRIDPLLYVTHRVPLERAAAEFGTWLSPSSGVIKALVTA